MAKEEFQEYPLLPGYYEKRTEKDLLDLQLGGHCWSMVSEAMDSGFHWDKGTLEVNV